MTLISIDVSVLTGNTFVKVATDPQNITDTQINTLSNRKIRTRRGKMDAKMPQAETMMEMDVKTMSVTRSVLDRSRSKKAKRRTKELTRRTAHHLKRSRAIFLQCYTTDWTRGCCYLFIFIDLYCFSLEDSRM